MYIMSLMTYKIKSYMQYDLQNLILCAEITKLGQW